MGRKSAFAAAVMIVLTAIVAFAGTGTKEITDKKPIYGFGVKVLPDEEFDDFVRCSLTVFELETEEQLAELPPLRIMAGTANTMGFRGIDEIEVKFGCTVNPEQTEVSYEVTGTIGDQLLMSHMATIRLQ